MPKLGSLFNPSDVGLPSRDRDDHSISPSWSYIIMKQVRSSKHMHALSQFSEHESRESKKDTHKSSGEEPG